MSSPHSKRRYSIIFGVVLALLAMFLCVILWRQYIRPPEPTPTPVAAITPIPTVTTAVETATPSPALPGAPITGGVSSEQPPITPFPGLVAGMYVGYDQAELLGNGMDYARGSHIFIPWRRIEDLPRGYYDWTLIDEPLSQLAPGKKGVIRLVPRCRDVPSSTGGMRDSCAPMWALDFDPVIVEDPPCDVPTKRLNYLNPAVQQGLINLIMAMGERYRDDDRVAAIEIGIGYAGEPVPWPHTLARCDTKEQKEAYLARPEYALPGKAWAEYHKRIIDAYVKAFQGKKPLLTIINSAYAEIYHGDVVRHAVQQGVGLELTSLRSDYYANRGSGDNVCYWGFITEPGFDNDSETADAAYVTQWTPLIVNQDRVPIGFEFNNRYDNTWRIPIEGEAFTRWSMLNALDKGADYVLAFNDGRGLPGNVRYPDVWHFFNRYAGRDAGNTPDVWIVFRSSWKEDAWCPDIYDYSWHLISELETLPYADAESQSVVNVIDQATDMFDVGPQSDWRYYFSRTTADLWPVFNLDIDDDFLYNGSNEVDIVVTYFDHDQGGDWALYYDSVSGEKLAGRVTITGSGQWKTKVFRVTDARFANGLPVFSKKSRASGFDLRLDREDEINDIFSMVQVVPIGERPPLAPSPTPVVSPTATATPAPTPTPSGEGLTIRLQQGMNGYEGVLDTYLSAWHPDTVYNKKTVLAVRINNIMSSLIKFDLKQIPPGSKVLKATLHLTRVDPRDPTVRLNIYALRRNWDASATYNRATKKVAWQKPGATGQKDADPEPLNDAEVVVPPGGVADFDIAAIVQKWVNNPALNKGVIIRGKSKVNKQYSFGSSDTSASLRPYLEIRYIPPTPQPTATPTATPTSTTTPTPTSTSTPPPAPTATAPPTTTPTATAGVTTQPPTATPIPPTATPTATATAAPTATPEPTCLLQLARTVYTGPHPKGVAAWPEGALLGMKDDGSLAVVTQDGNISHIGTSGEGANAVVYSDNGLVYMVHRDSNNVSVIDPFIKRQLDIIEVGGLPWGAASSRDRLFVANYADDTVSVIDLTADRVMATRDIHAMPALVAAGSNRVYVSHLDGYISVIGYNGAILDVFGPLPDDSAFGVALDEAGHRLFVSNRAGREVLALNSDTGEIIKRIDVAPNIPYALSYAPATGLLYVVDAVNNRLLGIQPDRGEVFANMGVSRQNADHGGQGLAVSSDGRLVYVPAYEAGILDMFKAGRCP